MTSPAVGTFSCVIDEDPRFHLEALRWFASITAVAGASPCDLTVHVVGSADSDALDILEGKGVTIRPIRPFDSRSAHCNKIAGALSLAAAGVDVSSVHATHSQPTGIAEIWVERAGQNSIVVAGGANGELSPADIESVRNVYLSSTVSLFQLETPLKTVEAALRVAREAGAVTVLDPAPARPLPAALLALVEVLTPNESEACILLGREPSRVGLEEAREMAAELRKLGPRAVVVKLGDQGCLYADEFTQLVSPGFKVEAVDSTAAGDTFNAALGVALCEKMALEAALRFANAAAAISVTRLGAQSSAPSRDEVEAFLSERRNL